MAKMSCLILLLAALFPLVTEAAAKKGAINVRGEAVSASDMAALPPLCHLLLENEGIHHSTGQKRNAELFMRPEYQMAKGNIHVHHYCWALVSKQRYFRESAKGRRDFYFDRYLGDINYVFEHSPKTWGFFDVLHLELAGTYLIRGDQAKAIHHADQAIAARPASEKAYVVKSDAYKQMGKKALAVETALEGLKRNPDSKVLRSRLGKLGVKPPAPEEIARQAPADEPVPTAAATAETGDEGASTAEADGASSQPAPPTTESAATASQDAKPNPYCRFCP